MPRFAQRPSLNLDHLSQMQELESRRLMAATVSLPFRLDFANAVTGTVLDKDGQGTGFTASQGGTAGQLDINTAKGTLGLTADAAAGRPTAALETAFDGQTRGFTLTARLLGPLTALRRVGDQAGLFFGPDAANRVSVTAVYTSAGERLQFSAVVNGQSVTADASTYVTLAAGFASISTLDVQLTGDAVTGQVSARYAINGKSWTRVAFNQTVPAASKAVFFNSASRTGVLLTDRHAAAAVTATFDSFSIDAGVTAYVPVATISRPRIALSDLTGGGSSAAQTLRVTNTGEADLIISAAAIGGENGGEFTLTNPLASTITLKSGQRYDFYVTYKATNSGSIRNATLTLTTNDPAGTSSQVALRGLGLGGAGGAFEPALQRIIDIYGFKTNTGQSTTSNAFDKSIDSADEVTMPRLVKAASGPVSYEMLGVFANQVSRTTFGWYEAGNPQTTYAVGSVSADKAQSLSPLDDGILYFDPGASPFGVYGNFTLGSTAKPINRNVFSEDVLNAWETNPSNQKKVRFYKLRDASGNVVENAYIVTMEEYNVTFDQNDIVGILRNVQPAAAGAELGLENLDNAPFADHLVMSRVRDKNTTLPNEFHDVSTLRVRNTGNQSLTVSDMVLSNADFVILSGGGPRTLAPGAYVDVKVQFVFNDSAQGNKLRTGTLTINSNDTDEAAKVIQLRGIWQSHSEDAPNGQTAEPSAQRIVEAFGYGTKILNAGQKIDTKGVMTAVGDEVLSELWQRADTGLGVSVRMLATYHQQWDPQWNTRSALWTYDPTKINSDKGKPTLTLRLAHNQKDSQSVLPRLEGSDSEPAVATFIPGSGTFGFNIDGYNGTFSQQLYNTPNDAGNPGHGWRFYVAKDAKGNIIPDTYIACQDYVKVAWANYDYQDNVLLITNVKPVSAPQTVQGVAAAGTADGVAVSWKANTANDVTAYNVYRRPAGNGEYARVAVASGTGYNDTTTVSGQWYDYYVTAAAYQGGESAPGTVVSAAAGSGTVTAPAAPSGVVATANAANSVTIKWADNSTNESGFRIERKTANGSFAGVGVVAADVLSFTDTGTAGSTGYVYRVVATNAAGDSAVSNEAAVTTPAATPSTPVGLTGTNIGNPQPAGTVTTVTTVTTGRDYDVRVGGADIFGTSDSFHFLHGQKTGDFDVSVRVTGLTQVDPSSQAGLMVRESLAANSKNLHIKARSNGLRLTYRSATGGSTTAAGSGEANFPNVFLRLRRVGNTFTSYTSADGQTWTAVGTVTLSLGSTVYVGLATCAKSQSAATTANYRNYGDTGSVSTPAPAATAAPTNLAAAATSPTSVALTWADNADNETGYRVERQAAGVWSVVATVAANATAYTDATASPSTLYHYRVVATGPTDSAASNVQTVTTPAAASTATTLSASGDTYVFDGSSSTNYGTAAGLQVKKSSAGFNRQAYVAFDVGALGGVTTATLRLYANLNTADNVQVAVSGVSGPLNEATTTWSNKPASGSVIGTAAVSGTGGAWIDIDVTAYVKTAKAAGQSSVTFAVTGTANSTAFVSIASRESGANGPQLVVA